MQSLGTLKNNNMETLSKEFIDLLKAKDEEIAELRKKLGLKEKNKWYYIDNMTGKVIPYKYGNILNEF